MIIHTSDNSPAFSVSAIIAVYNPDISFLKQAVSSVLSQSYPVLELVLVNDGGSEDFRGYLPDDPRIKVFSKHNQGVAATRNYAIGKCTGDYIAFLDQDDYWFPDKLYEQVSLISQEGEKCMVTSYTVKIDADGKMIQKDSTRLRFEYLSRALNEKAFINLVHGNFIFSSTPLIHHSVFKEIGGFDSLSQPHDDWDMYLRILLARIPIYFYKIKPLSVWRTHCFNGSNSRSAMLASKCRVENKLLVNITDKRVKRIVASNLNIDILQRINLIYEKKQYVRFRAMINSHFFRDLWNTTGRSKTINCRIHKIHINSMIRYILTFIRSN